MISVIRAPTGAAVRKRIDVAGPPARAPDASGGCQPDTQISSAESPPSIASIGIAAALPLIGRKRPGGNAIAAARADGRAWRANAWIERRKSSATLRHER